MRRAVGAAVVAALLGSVAAASPRPTDRQAILVVTEGRGYAQALRHPLLAALARRGGIGLMTMTGAEGPVAGAITIGAGRGAATAPDEPIRFDGDDGGITVEVAALREAARPAVMGLLGATLAGAGRSVGYVDTEDATGDPAMLAAIDAEGRIPAAALNEFPTLGSLPSSLTGGRATEAVTADLVVTPTIEAVPFLLERSPRSEVLVVVVSTEATAAMRGRGDVTPPAVLARGMPGDLLDADDRPRGLTSDTTRRPGLVSNVDVAPTVLRFLGVAIPGAMVGSPIRVTGEPPSGLHARAIRWRSVVTPVGLATLAFALLALLAGVGALAARRSARRLVGGVAVAGLASVAALVMLIPAALLPSLELPIVVGAITLGAVLLTWAAIRLDRGEGRRAVTVVALGGLTAVIADGLLGWPTGLTPFLGGSALDGVRFFGLGNPYAGIVLAGAVLTASRLSLPAGSAVLIGATLFAGLPFLGADLGGGLTLAVATGLWLGMSRWGRLGWRTLALAGAVAAAALAVFVVTHQLLPPGATHVSRTVETSGGALGAVEVWWRRLLLNVETTSEVPVMWLALAGLPAWLVALAARPPRLALEDERWRWGAMVLAASGIAGYILNDTYGTASIAFVFLTAAVVFPALWIRARTPATAPPDG